jgi:hypothetical protein
MAELELNATERTICAAISDLRLVTFVLHGHARIGEPHDFGIIHGQRKLFFYQTGGSSNSGSPLPWRWAVLPKISNFEILPRHFAGPRPIPSGRHHKWDRLIASVSRPPAAE